MNKQLFLDSGYKEYPCPPHKNWAVSFLQKKVADESGIKYLINVFVNVYAEDDAVGFASAEVQFSLTSITANVEILHFQTIEELELFFKKMFIVTDAYYYEKY